MRVYLLTAAIVNFQRKVLMPVPIWGTKEGSVDVSQRLRHVFRFSLFLGYAAGLLSTLWFPTSGAFFEKWWIS